MLGKKITQNFIFNILSMVLSFASSVFIARIGGAALFGNISLATSFQALIRSLFIHSISNAHLKFANDDKTLALKNLLVLNLVFNLFSSLLIGLFVLWNVKAGSSTFSNLQLNLIIIFIVQDYFAMPLFIYLANQNAQLNVVRANTVDFFAQFLINTAKIVTVIIGFREIGIAFGIIIACLLGSVYPLISLAKLNFGKVSMTIIRKYIRYSLYISTSALALGLLLSFDKILLGFLSVAPEHIGYYNAGNRLGVMVMSMGISVGGIFMAVFTKNLQDKNPEKSISQLKQYERYVTITFLPLILLFIFFGKEILGIIYGQRFQEAYLVLILALIVAYIKTSTIPYQNYLFANNMFRKFNQISLVFSIAIVLFTTVFAMSGIFPDKPVAVAFGLVAASLLERTLFVMAASGLEDRIKLFFNPGLLVYFLCIVLVWFFSESLMHQNFVWEYIIRTGILLAVVPIGIIFRVYKQSDFNLVINMVKTRFQ